jgi:hypothetical protein
MFFAAGRLIGFICLTGLATASLAAVVLLPAHARLAQANYERDCLAAQCGEAESFIKGYDRMLAEAAAADGGNEVFYQRLAMSLGMSSPKDVLVRTPEGPPSPRPGMVSAVHLPRPDPPSGWMIAEAQKLENPSRRRGLLLLAAGAMLTAVFLFAPPEKYLRRRFARA